MNLREAEGTRRYRNQAGPSAVRGRLLSAGSSLSGFFVSYGRRSDAGYALLSLYYITHKQPVESFLLRTHVSFCSFRRTIDF
jgi:hypothetical protein